MHFLLIWHTFTLLLHSVKNLKLFHMKQLENYAVLPFGALKVGRDLFVGFFNDHFNRTKQATTSGAPFGELLTPFGECLARLTASKTGTAVNLAQQGSDLSLIHI